MKQLITLLAIWLPFLAYSQSLEKEVITADGGYISTEIGNLHVNWSVGELATSTIETDQIKVTQGFHQLDILVDPIYEWPGENLTLNIFPNPTPGQINLVQDGQRVFEVRVRNLLGQTLIAEEWTGNEKILDLRNLPTQTYLLTIQAEGAIKSFKIIKS